jgi:hypothetical protein
LNDFRNAALVNNFHLIEGCRVTTAQLNGKVES